MANTPRPHLSSAFDEMLAKTKTRFDDLYRAGAPRTAERLAPATQVARRTPPAGVPRGASMAAADWAAARLLNERFGQDWRYEIAEETRDGDEAIVLGRLTFGRDNAVRTQFGRAKIVGSSLAAASEGVRFKIGGSGTVQDERDAFRRAAEAALMNCVDLI
jgi:hypothetical protein